MKVEILFKTIPKFSVSIVQLKEVRAELSGVFLQHYAVLVLFVNYQTLQCILKIHHW